MSASCPAIMIFPPRPCADWKRAFRDEDRSTKEGGPNNFVADVFLGHLIPTEGTLTMHTFLESHRQTKSGLASTLLSGIFILGLALAPPAAGMGAGGGGGAAGAGAGGSGGGAGAGAGSGGAGAGGGGGGGGGTVHPLDQSGLTTCLPGMVWDTKHQKCLVRHSRMLPDPELTK
jgi:hypothetical protein